jgi:hypothetical protein
MTIEELKQLVDEQAEDDGLWFNAVYASEAYLQKALRELHAEIEAYASELKLLKSQWEVTVSEEIIQKRVREAVEEAVKVERKRGRAITDKMIDRSFETGKSEAYEDAAKIAEGAISASDLHFHIARLIRARAKEIQ